MVVTPDTMPAVGERRGSIGMVKPSGWRTVRDDSLDGKYLYNRCHLIAWSLSGMNAEERNLITGTRYMNVEGMLPYETQVANYIERTGSSVLYKVTPDFRDNELVATMIGNFQDGRYGAGKIQFGSGWWFLDQKDGMEKQMNALSTLGLLSRFVGMLTDSRSFLSYTRHEYFRSTLCNLVGNDIEQGLLPASEIDFIGREIIEGICYRNAKDYFKF